jgi:asparagine synthase (glutamine-hydrolysing)
MCGIAGLFRAAGLDAAPLTAMVDALTHRGPDERGEGTWPHPAGAATACGLGVRRLAITDPANGHQPASDESGRLHVVLNGEIYNHKRLRTELQGSGVRFQTASDTEVLANLIARVGIDSALAQLRGMFAFAAYDAHAGRLWIVRDRMGQKPLYWATLPDGTLAWASELHSLRAHPGTRGWTPDRAAQQALLLWEYVPTPLSVWREARKLEPGTLLEVDAEGVRPRRWWTPPVPEAGRGGNLERWARSVRGALEVCTRQRVDADVDVGFLLSGGIDSSSVIAIAQANSPRPLRTFSVAVDAPGFDESSEARRVAAALGTQHQERRLGPGDLGPLLDEIGRHMSEPLADSSLVATWMLMAMVREAGVKCVLSGDGADENFAGYPTYLAHRLAPAAAPVRRLLGRAVRRLPTRHEGVTADYMARRFTGGLGMGWAHRHQHWMGAWSAAEVDPAPALAAIVDAHAAAASATDPVSRAMYLDQRLYLSDGVLVKVDRASMAHGVEVRSPFLDHTLVELAASIPSGHKLRGRTTKVVLKRAVADLLPEETVRRKKKGFGTPVGPWLRGPCAGLLDGLPDALADLVPPDRLASVIAEHREGAADHRRRLWSALVLARWRAHHGAGA